MAVEVGIQEHGVALVAVLVLLPILALFNQVVVQRGNLDHLLTLPARRQHRALFPVVNIDGLLVEVLIEVAAEVACPIIHLFLAVAILGILVVLVNLLHLLLLSGHLLLLASYLLLLSTTLCFGLDGFCCATFGSSWIDVSLDNRFLALLGRRLILVVAPFGFSEQRLNLIDLGLS